MFYLSKQAQQSQEDMSTVLSWSFTIPPPATSVQISFFTEPIFWVFYITRKDLISFHITLSWRMARDPLDINLYLVFDKATA